MGTVATVLLGSCGEAAEPGEEVTEPIQRRDSISDESSIDTDEQSAAVAEDMELVTAQDSIQPVILPIATEMNTEGATETLHSNTEINTKPENEGQGQQETNTVDRASPTEVPDTTVEELDNLVKEVLLVGDGSIRLPPDGQGETTAEGGGSSGSGSMNASTESEGFQENSVEKELAEEECITIKVETEAPVLDKKKPELPAADVSPQKSENKEKPKPDNTQAAKPANSVKSKKKEDKGIEHILRALNSLHTTEEKLAALCKKYADLHEEHRTVQTTFKQTQRKLTVVTREKDQLQSEHTKAVMAKSKLESLCRELQKHNQIIRQESVQRAKEEDEKRKEISTKFQTTIGEIQQQMQDNHDRNVKLREENAELAGKLKKFIEQYELREQHVEKVMQHRELEQKLADAKLQQAQAILNEEQAKSGKEKEILLLQITENQKRSQLLETQLAMYKEKYEEFQSTINRSNEMFQKFKTEMDKNSKRIKKLEKDGAAWKAKWENSQKSMLEMAEEKSRYDKEKQMLSSKISKLESLCRAMQAERQGRKVLEAAGVDLADFDKSSAASGSDSQAVPVSVATFSEPEQSASHSIGDGMNCAEREGNVPNAETKETEIEKEEEAESEKLKTPPQSPRQAENVLVKEQEITGVPIPESLEETGSTSANVVQSDIQSGAEGESSEDLTDQSAGVAESNNQSDVAGESSIGLSNESDPVLSPAESAVTELVNVANNQSGVSGENCIGPTDQSEPFLSVNSETVATKKDLGDTGQIESADTPAMS